MAVKGKTKDFADDFSDPITDYGVGIGPESGSFVGPDGTDPNGFTPGDYNDLNQQNDALGVTQDPGGSPSSMQQLIRALTGSNGGGSGMGALGALLPFLAMAGGGLMSRSATNNATHQIQDSLANANTQVSGILGGASGMYKPYQDAGLQGLAGMQAFPKSNLAANFGPIGSGRSLSSLARGK